MVQGKMKTGLMTKAEIVKAIENAGAAYWLDPSDVASDEYAHFYFSGMREGKEVIFDAVLYTLRLQHESELFEIAEKKAGEHFPPYKKIREGNTDGSIPEDLEEEIGLFMAEIILELEEEEAVKVQEHVDEDTGNDLGIGLDIGLHVEKITPAIIARFVDQYKSGQLKLDPTLHSFQTKAAD
jgi:hypothetical protein